MNPDGASAGRRPRVLLVDDDPNILAGYQRTLRKIYEIELADDGSKALKALKEKGPYAVIVVDSRMPGISGLDVLLAAQRSAPDTIRIMLTGAEDQQTAADAVNTGKVFRFLSKPCNNAVFAAAVRDAIEQFDRARHERVLLDQTFNGAVAILTDVLAAVAPEAFHRGQRLRSLARLVGEKLELPSLWELESAAMLLNIGMVTVPPDLADRFQSRKPLTGREAEIAARIPEIGAQLLEKVPRLSPVAEIIRFQFKGFDGSGPPDVECKRDQIPVGARVIRAVADLQEHMLSGLSLEEAAKTLKEHINIYDPQVLDAIDELLAGQDSAAPDHTPNKYLRARDLLPGMILEADAFSDSDIAILKANTELTEMFVARLQNFAELGQLREPLVIVPSSIPSTAEEQSR